MKAKTLMDILISFREKHYPNRTPDRAFVGLCLTQFIEWVEENGYELVKKNDK